MFVCLAQFGTLIDPAVPWVKIVLFGVGYIELNYIDENHEEVTGYSFIDKIGNALKNVRKIKKP